MMKTRKVVCGLVVLAFVAIHTVNAGLVGQWMLDDGTGQVAADSSGYGYDGQLGSTSGVDADDPIWEGDAARFGGTYSGYQYVNLDAQVSTFSALTQGTISVVFKKDLQVDGVPLHVNNNQVMFSISDNTTGSCEFVLYTEAGVLKVMSRGGTGNLTMVSGANIAGENVGVTDGLWHRAALTVDGSGNAALYLDGAEVATATGANFLNNVSSGSYTANTLAIGANDDSGTGKQWAFDGLLSDVRVYDNALSAAEIAALPIPEPATMVLLGMGMMLFNKRKYRE